MSNSSRTKRRAAGRRWNSAAPRRRGMTLLELMLVLAVIIVILGITWPLLDRPLAYERLRKSADLVIAEWASARVEALRSGVHQIFRFQPQSPSYELVGEGNAETRELPEGIVFVTSIKSADSREELEGGPSSASEPEIWFYPDGTTSDVPELLLRNEYGMQIRLTLRGLTGIAAVDTEVPDDVQMAEAGP